LCFGLPLFLVNQIANAGEKQHQQQQNSPKQTKFASVRFSKIYALRPFQPIIRLR
jgi:hypothetical protein